MSEKRVHSALNRDGFSLVELLVVITFIAIIWVVWFVYGSNFKSKEYNGRRVADLAGLESIIQSYAKTHGNTLPNPKTNAIYYDSLGIYVHAGSGSTAYGVSSKASRDVIGKEFANELPTDPDTKQFYGYGKLINNSAFSLATVVKENDEFRAYVRGSYDGKRLPSLVRAYNGGSFVSQDSTDDLPYNPYEKRLTAKVTHSDSGATITIKRNGLALAGNPLETEIEAHDTVTVENGGATMMIADGTEVTFGTGAGNRTSLALNTLEYADIAREDSVATKVKVALLEGESWFKAPKLDPESTLEASTETAVAAVRWTMFGMSKSGSLSRIVLVEGKLSIKQAQTVGAPVTTNISGASVRTENGESVIEVLAGQPIERIDLQAVSGVSIPTTFSEYSSESATGSTELANLAYSDPFEYAKESLIRGFTGTRLPSPSTEYSGSISITNPYRTAPFDRNVQSGSLTYGIRAVNDTGASTSLIAGALLPNPDSQSIQLQSVRYNYFAKWLTVDICSKAAISASNPNGCREVGKVTAPIDPTGAPTVIRTAFPQLDTSGETKIQLDQTTQFEQKTLPEGDTANATKTLENESSKTQTGEAGENVQTEANTENMDAVNTNSTKTTETRIVFDETDGYKAEYGANLPQGKKVYAQVIGVLNNTTGLMWAEYESATRNLWFVRGKDNAKIVPSVANGIFGKLYDSNPRFRTGGEMQISSDWLILSSGTPIPIPCDQTNPYAWSGTLDLWKGSGNELGSNWNVSCYWALAYSTHTLWWTNCGSAYFKKNDWSVYYGIFVDNVGGANESALWCWGYLNVNRKDALGYNIADSGITGTGAAYKISTVVRGGGLLRTTSGRFDIITAYSGAATDSYSRTISVSYKSGSGMLIYGAAIAGNTYMSPSQMANLNLWAFDRAEISLEIAGSGAVGAAAAPPAVRLKVKNMENGKEEFVKPSFVAGMAQLPHIRNLAIGGPIDTTGNNTQFNDIILEAKIVPGRTETVCVDHCDD